MIRAAVVLLILLAALASSPAPASAQASCFARVTVGTSSTSFFLGESWSAFLVSGAPVTISGTAAGSLTTPGDSFVAPDSGSYSFASAGPSSVVDLCGIGEATATPAPPTATRTPTATPAATATPTATATAGPAATPTLHPTPAPLADSSAGDVSGAMAAVAAATTATAAQPIGMYVFGVLGLLFGFELLRIFIVRRQG